MTGGWIDISCGTSSATPEWPGDTPFSCGWTLRIDGGASVNLSAFTMSPHVGTHADAPVHVHDGWPASDMLPLAVFAGPAVVCRVDVAAGELELAQLRGLPPEGRVERVLLRTGRSIAAGTFPGSWPTLSVAAVIELLARGLRLLGVDAPSVDARDSKTLEVHQALFGGGAYNLENLDLSHAEDGAYELFAFPMRVLGVDAAPVRAVLRRS
ncbi:MAG: cyclase family protein [Gemmatimonadaceae bacterium]